MINIIYPKWLNESSSEIADPSSCLLHNSLAYTNAFLPINWPFQAATSFLNYSVSLHYLMNVAKQHAPSSVGKLNSSKKRVQPEMASLLARMRWYKQGYYEASNLMDSQFFKMIH